MRYLAKDDVVTEPFIHSCYEVLYEPDGLAFALLEMGALMMGLVFLLVGLISIVGLIGFSTSVPSTSLGINSARGVGKFR